MPGYFAHYIYTGESGLFLYLDIESTVNKNLNTDVVARLISEIHTRMLINQILGKLG